jgi:hypothetical protein
VSLSGKKKSKVPLDFFFLNRLAVGIGQPR